MYSSAAGLRRIRDGDVTPGAAPAAAPITEPQPPSDTAPPKTGKKWSPRYTAKQLRDAGEATAVAARHRAQDEATPVVGAPASKFAVEPSYFNILYTHPLFGHQMQWGTCGTQQLGTIGTKTYRTKKKLMPLLPPVNSRAGMTITAAERRTARVNWGNGKAAFPRPDVPEHLLPVSPSKHCFPCRPLAEVEPGAAPVVSKSTNPWMRKPPHRGRTRQIYEAMYGPAPKGYMSGIRGTKQEEKAAIALQARQRGNQARKAM